MENPTKNHFTARDIQLSEYIDDETHHELGRRGFEWNGAEERFEGLSPDSYKQTRNAVLDALVLSSVGFFKTGGLDRKDKANLRTNLSPYLHIF